MTTDREQAERVADLLRQADRLRVPWHRCDQDIDGGAQLSYARNNPAAASHGRTVGPRGNIRDSSHDVCGTFQTPEVSWPMDKWLVSFLETIP